MNLETEVTRELWQAVRRSYESEAWSNAVLDSIHYLSDALRAKTGLQSDGTVLVGQALGGKAPKLRLNRLQTESEKNVQAGVEQLLRGIYQAIRNPRSHERMEDTQADADAIIVFVQYILQVVGHARSAFSVEQAVGRILEKGFVPTQRYASLVIEEIPPRKRPEVGIEVFERKTEANAQNLRIFLTTLIAELDEGETRELFHVISTELRESDDDAALRATFQLLEPDKWLSIDEAARLRTENRIIRNVQEGRYQAIVDKCLAGALATWSRDFWPHFTLKNELLQMIVAKLSSSSVESQDYVLKYCFTSLEHLAPVPTLGLSIVVLNRLKAGDSRFKQAMSASGNPWNGKWGDSIVKSLESFQAAEEVPGGPDDDIPF